MDKTAAKKYAFFFLVVFIISRQLLLAKQAEDQVQTPLQKLADINMNAFPWHEDAWITNTLKEFLERHVKDRFNPKPRYKRRAAFTFFQAVEKRRGIVDLPLINDTQTWQDLNLFCGKADVGKSVAFVLDRTYSEFGRISFYWLLAEPTHDAQLLEDRQRIIKKFINDQAFSQRCEELFVKLQSSENILLSFWDYDSLKNFADNSFFKNSFLRQYNENENVLYLKSLGDHQGRIWSGVSTVCATVILTTYGLLLATNLYDAPQWLKGWADNYRGMSGPLLSTIARFVENR
jgi:hypothetical protein